MRLFLVILLWRNPCVKVIAASIHDFHDVRGRESKSSNLSLDQVVVRGAAIEHKDANHDGFYSITFDPVTIAATFSSSITFQFIYSSISG